VRSPPFLLGLSIFLPSFLCTGHRSAAQMSSNITDAFPRIEAERVLRRVAYSHENAWLLDTCQHDVGCKEPKRAMLSMEKSLTRCFRKSLSTTSRSYVWITVAVPSYQASLRRGMGKTAWTVATCVGSPRLFLMNS